MPIFILLAASFLFAMLKPGPGLSAPSSMSVVFVLISKLFALLSAFAMLVPRPLAFLFASIKLIPIFGSSAPPSAIYF